MRTESADREWKQAIDEHDAKLEALEQASHKPCFSRSEFSDRVAVGDGWQKLIQAHLYLEFIATRMLEAEFPNPEEISLSRMGISARLDLISAMGLVPQEYIPVVRKVARLRSLVAHDLSFEVTDQQPWDLCNTIPKWMRKIAEEADTRLEKDGPLTLHELLRAAVLYFEMFRQQRAAWNARRAHLHARQEIVRGMLKHVLDTTGPDARKAITDSSPTE